METLAYLYLAQEYEQPDLDQEWMHSVSSLQALSQLNLSGKTLLTIVGFASSLWSLGLAGLTQAALAYPSFRDPETRTIRNVVIDEECVGSNPIVPIYPVRPVDPGFIPVRPDPNVPSGQVRVLLPGDRGAEVDRLQRLLSQAGYFSGPYTGYYGPITEHAVREFQRDNGLLADGVTGPETFASLQGFRPVNPGRPTPTPTGDRVVFEAQSVLSRLGYYAGAFTGVLDRATTSAIRQFQLDNGITATGQLDSLTIGALGLRSDYAYIQ